MKGKKSGYEEKVYQMKTPRKQCTLAHLKEREKLTSTTESGI